VIAQDPEERRIGRSVDLDGAVIDDHSGHCRKSLGGASAMLHD
jgi:hypothetical protein